MDYGKELAVKEEKKMKKCEMPGCQNEAAGQCEEPECGMHVCLEHSADDPRLEHRSGFLCLPCLQTIKMLETNRLLSILQDRDK